MRLIPVFLRLVRWPNLVFIGITQLLFFFCIVVPNFEEAGVQPNLSGFRWLLLVVSSVLIAAAGNIINDYFDLNIDIINKPQHVVIDKHIKRRWAIVWHIVLSLIGILIGFYIDATSRVKFLGFANAACVLLLFVYSISLKKKLLIGNIVISLLTAWTVLVISYAETSNLLFGDRELTMKLTRISFLYAGFAYIISLVREVVKDMEDINGDRIYGCKTMPIVWGMVASRIFVSVWLVILIILLCIVQFYVLQFGWWISAIYCILLIIVPLLLLFKRLARANNPADYHRISSQVKWIMLAGIFSMIFFRIFG